MKKLFVLLTVLICVTGLTFASGVFGSTTDSADPVRITILFPDNATLPFRNDWLTVRQAEQMFNARITWEPIPIADFTTRANLVLTTGINTPDVILYLTIAGDIITLAQNGQIVPIGDYTQWTPNFNARVQEFGRQVEVDQTRVNGKLYSLPRVFDSQFFDGGLILREDLLQRYNMAAPRTFDELYTFLARYKAENPSSYPMTILAGPRVHYRFTQPSWGISVHANGAGGSRVLSWDYNRREWFAGAISEQYRDYMRFWSRLYREGLLDPEMVDPINGDVWTRKLATGSAIATYAYYDQIGGVTAASTIPGFKLNLYPPLAGPAGAFTQQKDNIGQGIVFPIATSRRPDFERIVRTVDNMFFGPQAELLWCIGVEGETYNMVNGQIQYIDSLVNSPDGIYKAMQLRYGGGVDPFQYVWRNAREMTKYDENYAAINRAVAAMPNVFQYIPPAPRFATPAIAERASSLMGILHDTFVVWDNAFLTGQRNIETEWNTYVNEMRSRGIDEFLSIYNNNR